MKLRMGSFARTAFLLVVLPFCRSLAQQESFGVATHFGNGWHEPETLIRLIREAGFGWIRDEVFLDQVEPEPGRLVVPKRLDHWLGEANAAGLKVCLVLNVYPGARSHGKDPYDPERYTRAAEFLARSLKGRIAALEILNEPNASGFAEHYGGNWNGRQEDGSDAVWIGKYVHLLNTAAERIKAANPEIKVIGLGAVPPANHRMLRQGISPRVDGIVEHPYSFRTVPEIVPYPSTPEILARDGVAVADEKGSFASLIEMLHHESAKTGGTREIWLTEWGYTTFVQDRETMHQPSTEEAQAAYALRRFVESLALGVKLSVYYNIRDNGPDLNEPEHHFGLLRYDGTPKPAYHSVKRLFTALARWKPSTFRAEAASPYPRKDRKPVSWDGAKLEDPDALVCHPFHNGSGEPALAMWSAERFPSDLAPRPARVSLELDQPGKVTAATTYEPLNGARGSALFEQNGSRVELMGLLVPAHPLLIELKVDNDLSAPVARANEFALERDALRLNRGEEFPGANATVSLSESDGASQLDLAYDFRDGGKYVEAQIVRVPEFAELREVCFRARGSAGVPLFLRLVDRSGETHQFPIPVQKPDEWHSLTVSVAAPHESWAGDGNGKIDLPVRSAGLGVRNESETGTEGRVSFASLTWE